MTNHITLSALVILFQLGMSCTQHNDKPSADPTFSFNAENEFLGLGIQQFGDLDSMIARRKIRALVPYTHLYYTIDLNKRSGVAFEALNLFENELNRQLHLK